MREWIAKKICPVIFRRYEYQCEALSEMRVQMAALRAEIRQEERLSGTMDRLLSRGYLVMPAPPGLVLYGHLDKDIEINISMAGSSQHCLRLYAVLNIGRREIFIQDIETSSDDVNKGYGTIAMEYLIGHAKRMSVRRIYGEISQQDSDHYERLVHFYNKFGFDVDLKMKRLELLL